MRIQDADRNSEFLIDDAHWFREVRIVCDYDELVAITAKSIDQHVCSEIYVGSFFLHFENIRVARTTRARRGQTHRHRTLQIVAIMYG